MKTGFLIGALAVGVVALSSADARLVPEGNGDIRVAMKTASGQSAGIATITETPHGLLIRYAPTGIPAGVHAIHLHERGRCEGPAFESAGGHFNPAKARHGFMSAMGYHAGDMPNIRVSAAAGTDELFVPDVSLQSGSAPLVDDDGAAMVVHAGVDDHLSDPAGNAGDRIACGVLRK